MEIVIVQTTPGRSLQQRVRERFLEALMWYQGVQSHCLAASTDKTAEFLLLNQGKRTIKAEVEVLPVKLL